MFVKPRQFALHLQREFAGWRDDQRSRRRASLEAFGVAEEVLRNRQPVGDGLAGAGLRRHEEIAIDGLVSHDGGLHRGRFIVVARFEGAGERRGGGQERHGMSDLAGTAG